MKIKNELYYLIGNYYIHYKKGTIYRITDIIWDCNEDEAKLEYQDINTIDLPKFTRSYSNFFEKITEEITRFSLIPEPLLKNIAPKRDKLYWEILAIFNLVDPANIMLGINLYEYSYEVTELCKRIKNGKYINIKDEIRDIYMKGFGEKISEQAIETMYLYLYELELI